MPPQAGRAAQFPGIAPAGIALRVNDPTMTATVDVTMVGKFT